MYVQDGKIKLGKIYKGTIQKVNKRLFMRANKCLLSACVKTIQRFFFVIIIEGTLFSIFSFS